MSGAVHRLESRAGVQPLRILAWVVGPGAISLIHWLTLEAHAIARMCALVAATFLWMKLVVIAENLATGKPIPSLGRLAAWTVLWPDMRVSRVQKQRDTGSMPDWDVQVLKGVLSIFAGLIVIVIGHWIGAQSWYIVFGWGFIFVSIPLYLIGLSLILHYGVFGAITGGWRYVGFDVGPLFRNPFGARSLCDFWTRRWNLAYAEMCQETVMRATRSWPVAAKRMAVFVFSGLLHEVAISLPVMRGFGLPTVYFVLNGAAMHLERKWFREGSIVARMWEFGWVVLPLPLLFHPWFLRDILLPLVGIRT